MSNQLAAPKKNAVQFRAPAAFDRPGSRIQKQKTAVSHPLDWPPVYRVQPASQALQNKKLISHPPQMGNKNGRMTAPPVYRPSQVSPGVVNRLAVGKPGQRLVPPTSPMPRQGASGAHPPMLQAPLRPGNMCLVDNFQKGRLRLPVSAPTQKVTASQLQMKGSPLASHSGPIRRDMHGTIVQGSLSNAWNTVTGWLESAAVAVLTPLLGGLFPDEEDEYGDPIHFGSHEIYNIEEKQERNFRQTSLNWNTGLDATTYTIVASPGRTWQYTFTGQWIVQGLRVAEPEKVRAHVHYYVKTRPGFPGRQLLGVQKARGHYWIQGIIGSSGYTPDQVVLNAPDLPDGWAQDYVDSLNNTSAQYSSNSVSHGHW